MSQQSNLIAMIQRGSGMLAKHLSDFSDADMLARPVPGANHAAWQVSHLLNSNNNFLQAIGGDAGKYDLPANILGIGKSFAPIDDPSRFAPKAELLATADAMTDKLVRLVSGMSDADFDAPTPEAMHGFAPTKGTAAMMVPLHTTMHIGQLQVIRRALGKPVLF